MQAVSRSKPGVAFVAVAATLALSISAGALAQPRFGQGPPGGQAQGSNLPSEPTAVPLPTEWAEITGAGEEFNSAPSQAPGLGLDHFDYVTTEYFVSGTAAERPYTSRVVVRRPADDSRFSGLVLAESMHSSGAAHAFEYTAVYVMDSGHAAVEILTTSPAQFVDFNAERYGELEIADGQANDILAQVGALMKNEQGPFGGSVRKMVMSGSSMSSGTLINYLPAHRVYRTPDMQHIYDGYMPTSVGSTTPNIDVPLIQLPTMHEVESSVPNRQDSDEPGQQYRLYEVAGIGHVDSRDNVRLLPNPCERPLSTFPTQAYMAVGLHHLLEWVDNGVSPPRADRILVDRNAANDGSMMALDEYGNPLGGIRNPYVDVPVAKYAPVNTAAQPLIDNPSEYVAANGMMGAQIMCRLSAYQEAFPPAVLRAMYGGRENYLSRSEARRNYLRRFEARLDELEQAGWSLPVYRDMILADAEAVKF